MVKDSPCHNCDRRYVTKTENCHHKCSDYLAYREELANLNKEERDNVYQAYIVNAVYRKRKFKNEKNCT
jgi:hypothetical protein